MISSGWTNPMTMSGLVTSSDTNQTRPIFTPTARDLLQSQMPHANHKAPMVQSSLTRTKLGCRQRWREASWLAGQRYYRNFNAVTTNGACGRLYISTAMQDRDIQGAPIKNNPIEKRLYFSNSSTVLSQTFRLYTRIFAQHFLLILLKQLIWFNVYNSLNFKVHFFKSACSCTLNIHE